MMTLREQRCLFTLYVSRLIVKAREMGFECALGEVVRDARVAQLNAKAGKGISNSLHLSGLAVDLHLYDSTGKYLADTEAHRPLGEWWETVDPNCRWGGRFRDGNHYSYTPDGRRA
jgi:hypothetical protein